jgi:hypothetical protein
MPQLLPMPDIEFIKVQNWPIHGFTYVRASIHLFMSQCVFKVHIIGPLTFLKLEGPSNVCFLSAIPLILGVHGNSQTLIGTPTLSVEDLAKLC